MFAHKPVSLGRGIYDLKSGCSMLRVPKKTSTPLELEECLSPAAIFFSKKKAYHTSTIVHRREETICLPGPCAYPAEAQARIVLLYPLPFSMSIESLEVCDSSSLPNIFAHWAGYVAALSLPTTELGWELLACPRTDKLCVLGFSSSWTCPFGSVGFGRLEDILLSPKRKILLIFTRLRSNLQRFMGLFKRRITCQGFHTGLMDHKWQIHVLQMTCHANYLS